jgi:hypothetical protein
MQNIRNRCLNRSFWAVVVAAGLVAGAAHAKNSNNEPTLHGFCLNKACTDNGTNTPTNIDPPVFGFNASGQASTGDVTLAILAPDNLMNLPTSYSITGYNGDNYLGGNTDKANLFSSTPWTSGKLAAYLGLPKDTTPDNPIGAYTLPMGATGFDVYYVDLGTLKLPGSYDKADLLTTQSLDVGTYIVAFISVNGEYGATANSGAILEKGVNAQVPEPTSWALMTMGVGGLGASLRSRRRALAQVA